MNSAFNSEHPARPILPRQAHGGTSTLDVLVALTLLVTVFSVSTPLVVRHGLLLKSQRNYRLALDELSNQLDRLSALPAHDLPGAIEQLAPSEFLTERLSGAQLSGELNSADLGTRVILKLTWNESPRRNIPVSLAAWVIQPPPGRVPEGGQP